MRGHNSSAILNAGGKQTEPACVRGGQAVYTIPDMGNKNKRPVFLNLLVIHLPIGGLVSILHRITGVFLVVLLPIVLYLLEHSLKSPVFFEALRRELATLPGRSAVLIIVWLSAQHLFSGIRHLLLDVDIGVGLRAARASAWVTLVASTLVTAVLAGMWRW